MVVKTLIATCTCPGQHCLLQSLLLHSEVLGWGSSKQGTAFCSLACLALVLVCLYKDGASSHVVILYRIYLQCTQQDEVSHLVQINKFSKPRTCMSPASNASCSAVFYCGTASRKMLIENTCSVCSMYSETMVYSVQVNCVVVFCLVKNFL